MTFILLWNLRIHRWEQFLKFKIIAPIIWSEDSSVTSKVIWERSQMNVSVSRHSIILVMDEKSGTVCFRLTEYSYVSRHEAQMKECHKWLPNYWIARQKPEGSGQVRATTEGFGWVESSDRTGKPWDFENHLDSNHIPQPLGEPLVSLRKIGHCDSVMCSHVRAWLKPRTESVAVARFGCADYW
jgi:hypothetical protein